MGFVEIGGLKIHYLAPGDPAVSKGQRVLYVHGAGCNVRIWEKHMQAMAGAHTPVAIDLPGHGESEGCGFRGAADYSNFVVKLAEALGWERFVAVGHSMGGAVVQATAAYNQEVLSGLILVGTGARLRVHPDILGMSLQAARSGRPYALERSWAYAQGTPQPVVEGTEALFADTDLWVKFGDWICADSFDFSTRVKDIQVPALAVCGAEDRLTPLKYHQYFEEKMPRCRLAVIPGAGHMMQTEQPEEFNRTVKSFLDDLPAI